MRDSCAMRTIERVRDFDRVLDRLIDWERPFGETGFECLALNKLQHHEVDIAFPANVEKRADVRMIE